MRIEHALCRRYAHHRQHHGPPTKRNKSSPVVSPYRLFLNPTLLTILVDIVNLSEKHNP